MLGRPLHPWVWVMALQLLQSSPLHRILLFCEVCLSRWARPSLGAASEKLSPRATSVPGLRVEQGAWGLAVPSRDPGTVDRCGPEGTEAPGGRPSVEKPPCLNQSYWPAAPVATTGGGPVVFLKRLPSDLGCSGR